MWGVCQPFESDWKSPFKQKGGKARERRNEGLPRCVDRGTNNRSSNARRDLFSGPSTRRAAAPVSPLLAYKQARAKFLNPSVPVKSFAGIWRGALEPNSRG
jgi:hypothetical protein